MESLSRVSTRILPIVVAYLAAILALNAISPINTSEGGWLEVAQVPMLAGAGAGWFLVAAHARRRPPGVGFAATLVALALWMGAISVAGAMRELDFGRALGMERDAVTVMKWAAAIGLLPIAAFATGYWLRRETAKVPALRDFFAGEDFAWLTFVLVIFLIADMLEKLTPEFPSKQLVEEAVELFAYAVLLFAAWRRHLPARAP